MWSVTLTRITAPSRIDRAGDWPATPWEGTALRASAWSILRSSGRFTSWAPAACLRWPGPADQVKERAIANEKKVAAAKSPSELAAQSPGFGSAIFATAAAWAPNPKNPPLYFDLPTKDGDPIPEIMAKFIANAPLAFVDQYVGNLKQYRAISMDVGDQDSLRVDATRLHELFDSYTIANSFEIYSGTHTSAVADRFQNHVVPFFSKNLCFTDGCR
jgi:hypothetical protein